LLHFKEVFSRWDSAFAQNGWLSIFLANHDQARLVSRFGNDTPPYRALSSKLLTTFLMTMRGTPYYYNGDELGMTNARFDKIEEYNDMPSLNEYQNIKNKGGDLAKYIEFLKFNCRDNGRTPFPWDDSENAGFTTGKPWLKINPNFTEINAKSAESDATSTLNYFKRVVAFRKANPILVYGKYTLLDKDNPDVYAYTREYEGQTFLILLNFSAKTAVANTGLKLNKAKVLLGNYPASSKNGTLKPYESVIYKLN
jgi:oligo-1,6-glucosidase